MSFVRKEFRVFSGLSQRMRTRANILYVSVCIMGLSALSLRSKYTYVRHFRRKQIKSRSADLIDVAKSREAGLRTRPLLFLIQRGWFRESKKRRRRVAMVMRPSGGIPRVSIIQANCSTWKVEIKTIVSYSIFIFSQFIQCD